MLYGLGMLYGLMLYGLVMVVLAVSTGVHGSGDDTREVKASNDDPEYHHSIYFIV